MTFCHQCGAKLSSKLSPDDVIPRLYCKSCDLVHYENPKILVSCFAYWQDKVLWMRRSQAPYIGCWSIPSGFMEQNESLQAGAARELFEETGAQIATDKMQLHTVGSLVEMSQVYVVFRAPLISLDFKPSAEALEVGLFTEAEFPWHEFAFPMVAVNVRQFYRELAEGHFNVYTGVLEAGVNHIDQIKPSP